MVSGEKRGHIQVVVWQEPRTAVLDICGLAAATCLLVIQRREATFRW